MIWISLYRLINSGAKQTIKKDFLLLLLCKDVNERRQQRERSFGHVSVHFKFSIHQFESTIRQGEFCTLIRSHFIALAGEIQHLTRVPFDHLDRDVVLGSGIVLAVLFDRSHGAADVTREAAVTGTTSLNQKQAADRELKNSLKYDA